MVRTDTFSSFAFMRSSTMRGSSASALIASGARPLRKSLKYASSLVKNHGVKPQKFMLAGASGSRSLPGSPSSISRISPFSHSLILSVSTTSVR